MEDQFIITAHHAQEKRVLAEQLRREMTPSEKRLWQSLRSQRLGGLHFRRQQIIEGFVVDFYCHSARLVIEVDGGVHRNQTDYDLERDRLIAGRGLHILRFTNAEVATKLQLVLNKIQFAAHQRQKE